MSTELGNSTTAGPLSTFAYEDLTVADGLAGFIANLIGPEQNTTLTLVLGPSGNSNHLALVHGSDLTDSYYHPSLEIVVKTETVPEIPVRRSLAEADLVGETWVESHHPTANFNNGLDGDGEIVGNEIGGQLRWISEGGKTIARGTLIQFELPILLPGETVSGVRLTGYSTESANAGQSIEVGLVTGPIDLSMVTFADVATGTDNFNFEIDWHSSVLMSTELGNSTTAGSLSTFAYEDLTVADGLASFIANLIDTEQNTTVTLVLGPSGDSNHLALFHGSDQSDPYYHPSLEIFIMADLLFLGGDANQDGVVSADDYASVQSNFGNTDGAAGDANDDGVVSADDYASVQSN